MNRQAETLQRMAASMEPASAGSVRWLIHSAGPCTGATTIRENLDVILEQMGWCTGQFSRSETTAVAQVRETEENTIDLNRLVPNVLLIFVLDGTPVTLVNTYSQIKQLLNQQPTLQNAIAVISNRSRLVGVPSNPSFRPQDPEVIGNGCGEEASFDQCPAKSLLRSCQRFLNWEPAYLGSLPYDSLVGVAASEKQAIVQRWPSCSWSVSLNRAARQALMISQNIEESTQEPDMLSRPMDVLHSEAEKAYPTLA